jgi:Cu(I)/Ag(I) efflux system membrane fusion protein
VPAAARTRLAVLGMSDRDIAALEARGSARRLVTIVAPRGGIVLRRGIAAGTAIDPSTELLAIADLARVWVLAELPESEAPGIGVGTRATLAFPGANRPPFPATVEFVYPTLAERTRAVRLRFSVANPDGALRPGLYGTATFAAAPREALVVPRDAVVDTGQFQHVFVRSAAGVLEPRRVRLGALLEDRIEVVDGLRAGEQVVAAGVFLIDSESRLRASGGGAAHAHGTPREASAETRGGPAPEGSGSGGHAAHGS